MRIGRTEFLKIPINERKYLIHRFVEQKEKEQAAMEAERRKKH